MSGRRYHNAMQSNGSWVGHGGFGGQWMAADQDSGCSLAFYSVRAPGTRSNLMSCFAPQRKASVRLAKRCGVAVQVFNSEGGVPVDLAAMSTEIFGLFK